MSSQPRDSSNPLHSLVKVSWDDAIFDLDEPQPVKTLHTVGWLYAADAAEVVIASEADSETVYFRAFTTIPASLVRRITPLTPAVAEPLR